ncbi:MAG: hypothetical protein ACRDJH_05340 [Thermomicrobiales bacterium]
MGNTFETAPGPVSAAFDLSPLSTDSMRDRVRRALAIVDTIHLARALPRIPIDHVVVPDARAQYRSQVNRGRALGIGIDPFEPRPELSIVHEIGHFLDHQAIGNRGGFASSRHRSLDAWRQVVGSTSQIRTLRILARASGEVFAGLLGRAPGPEDRERIESLLRYTEVWARSYAQYVVSQSASLLLIGQLAEERAEANPIQSLGFWDDHEFQPIRSAIDDLFRQKGWIDERTSSVQRGGAAAPD